MKNGRVLRRRKPFGSPGLWRVCLQGDLAAEMGYMVTTMGRLPQPVAFVLGTHRAALAKAVEIHLQGRRGRWAAWRKWLGFVLLPVDSRGRRVTTGSIKSMHFTRDNMVAQGVLPPEQYMACATAGGAL